MDETTITEILEEPTLPEYLASATWAEVASAGIVLVSFYLIGRLSSRFKTLEAFSPQDGWLRTINQIAVVYLLLSLIFNTLLNTQSFLVLSSYPEDLMNGSLSDLVDKSQFYFFYYAIIWGYLAHQLPKQLSRDRGLTVVILSGLAFSYLEILSSWLIRQVNLGFLWLAYASTAILLICAAYLTIKTTISNIHFANKGT